MTRTLLYNCSEVQCHTKTKQNRKKHNKDHTKPTKHIAVSGGKLAEAEIGSLFARKRRNVVTVAKKTNAA